MKQFLFLVLFSLNASGQVMWQVRSDTVCKWFYIGGDEFNGKELDETKWHLGMPWGNFVIQQDLYFARENSILKDGIIQFVASNEPKAFPITANKADSLAAQKNGKHIIDNSYRVNYTAGSIASKVKYKYGYFELRFKSTPEKGIWPAFWLYGGTPNEEIDFFELKGEKEDQIHLDVHCPKGCDDFRGGFLNIEKNWGGWIKLKESLADHWNIISGEWQPGYVRFFLNGQPIAYFEGDFRTAQNLFINTSVAREGQAFDPGPDATTQWPNYFLVDYVRVWSKEDTITIKPDPKVFENTFSTITQLDLFSNELKKKKSFIYNKRNLENEKGTLTLLPVGTNKYSLSVCGKAMGNVEVISVNPLAHTGAESIMINTEYTLLDYSAFPPGKYNIIIRVAGHTLIHDVDVR